jgi:hypothetical protein
MTRHSPMRQSVRPQIQSQPTIWGFDFNSPADAERAGCANTVTPSNGEHNAGIQVLNTSNFTNDSGPLRFLNP